jgi:GT2 family glycosyltransferase
MTNSLKLQRSNALKFSIIIPNYNGAQFLPDCLNSLDLSSEIIIVDNGSKDDSLSKIKELKHSLKIENCKLKINQINMGFASAVNQGIKAAKNDYVVICNNDLVVDKNYFKLLTDAIKKYPDYAAYVGTILNKDGTRFESQGLKFYYSGKCENILNGQTVRADRCVRPPYEVWGASAALVTYKKSVLEKIGYFDESFFAYEEDVDLALRLHKTGYKTLLIPQAICYHLGGGTSGKMGNFRQKQDFKNWIRLIHKNYSPKEKIIFFFPILFNLSLYFWAIIKNTLKMVKYSHDHRN